MRARKPRGFPWRTILAVVLLTTLPPSADRSSTRASPLFPAQESPQSDVAEQEPVTLWVAVRGKDGRLARDVPKEEFHIFEDGKAQSIVSLSASDTKPLSLGLLMQWSGQRRDTLPYAEIDPAAQCFSFLMKNNDAAFVARFSDSVNPVADFTNDPAEIERNLQRAKQERLYGPSALYDAIIWACREKLSSRSGHRILILVADGHDNGSRKQFSTALESALRTETTIYVVSLAYANPFYTSIPISRKNDTQLAGRLAEETGGGAIFVRDRKDLSAAFSQIPEELRSRFTLSYYSTNTVHNGKFRRIKIETTSKDLHVLKRSGYYAPKN